LVLQIDSPAVRDSGIGVVSASKRACDRRDRIGVIAQICGSNYGFLKTECTV
jgi:hypothetical protein